MKKFTLAAVAGILPLSMTFAKPFGNQTYIIKLKQNAPENVASILSDSDSKFTQIPVSFGRFLKLETKNAPEQVLALTESVNDIEYIEPNQIYRAIDTHVETEAWPWPGGDTKSDRYGEQWGLENDGKNSGGWFSSGKAGEDVNAKNAWSITKGDRAVKIAVIDTGVDYNHPDLKAQMWTNELEANGVAGVDDDGNGYIDDIHGYDFANNDGDPMDDHNHGTHCAGVIGASHNASGIKGVMANVQIVGVKFLAGNGSGDTEGAIKSVEYAMKVGVDVMSNSWGGGEFSQALKEAISAANDAGISFVVAAGNARTNNDSKATYPTNYDVDNVIAVGSMDGKGNKSGFSNYGATTVDIFAPGSSILSTVTNGKYQSMSGTSMACPFVAGGVGLLVSNEPNLTPLEIRNRIISTAVRTSNLKGYSLSGRMDMHGMLTK